MKEIPVSDLSLNPMTLIGNEWMLITAGNADRGFNTMTASWGHMGCIWNKPTCVAYVRPQRYTKEFIDRESLFTLCFFPEGCKSQLAYLGSHSGKEEDKVAKTGLTPVFTDGTTCFAEAKLVLVCKKLYRAPIVEEGFADPAIVENSYPLRDFHDMYVGQILKVLVSDED